MSGDMQTKKVTIVDIAKVAGVSQGTVANVLSGAGKSTIRVSEATRERVRSIARKLNYQPNLAGRILRGKGSRIIGVLLDSQAPQVVNRILTHIQGLASVQGYRIMVIQAHDNMTSFMEGCQVLEQYGTDGIIALSHDYPGLGVPLSFFEDNHRIVYVGEPSFTAPYVVRIDRSEGVREALDSFRKHGKLRPGMAIFPGESHALCQRRLSFCSQVQAVFGLSAAPLLEVPLSTVEENAIRIADWIQKETLDAVLVPDDFHGLALISELQKRGMRVPEDVAIVGCDDERFASLSTPGLSSISEDVEGQAKAALQTFMRMLRGEDAGKELVVCTHLVERGSI